MLALWKKTNDKPRQYIKKQRYYFATKVCIVKGWVPKNWCFQTMVLEKTLESPLDSKKTKTVNPKGNQLLNIHWKDWYWSLCSNTLATWCEWPTHWKRFWCWERLKEEEKGMTDDEMVGWHHWLNGHECEQTLGDDEGQGSLECCSPWDFREFDMT